MASVTVTVKCNGRVLKIIERPLHLDGQKKMVTYKGKLRPLGRDNSIEVCGAPRRTVGDRNKSRDQIDAETCAGSNATSSARTAAGTAAVIGETDPSKIKWDDDQKAVIEASSDARLLVEAGPGTGKTAVACARVARLLDEGVVSSGIWLFSFTRTAVQEIRQRIRLLAQQDSEAAGVRITTIDSHAWQVHQGFAEGQPIIRDYDENIAEVLKLVTSDRGDVVDFLASFEHIIVDEAQDMLGIRADLLLQIIRRLQPSCGVTVFADSAQAIYGFTRDDDWSRPPGGLTLPEKIRGDSALGFEQRFLKAIHRTSSEGLLKIYTQTRAKLLDQDGEGTSLQNAVTADVRRWGKATRAKVEELGLQHQPKALVLYRRRGEVLMASSYLHGAGIRHRVRMSGLPDCIAPWPALLFWDYVDRDLSRDTFLGRWQERITGRGLRGDLESEWQRCVRLAGRSKLVVEMAKLRRALARSRPPVEFCTPEFGMEGPIIGTIHASKGREADHVVLMMPSSHREAESSEEEARVIFVGATRARLQLFVGEGYKHATSDDVGRTYRLLGPGRAQLALGVRGDIDASGLVGRSAFATEALAQMAQIALIDAMDRIVHATAVRGDPPVYQYSVRAADSGAPLCSLSTQVNEDLFAIGRRAAQRATGWRPHTPKMLPNLWISGIRSLVLAPDDPLVDQLHAPFNASGFLIAPLLLAYPTVFLD